jgi:hypothetical protein
VVACISFERQGVLFRGSGVMSKLILEAGVYRRLLVFLFTSQRISAEELLQILRVVKGSSDPLHYNRMMSGMLSALLDRAGF